MKLYEVIERIEFNIHSADDLSGKSVNSVFSKKNIVYALQTALNHYSQFTLGIQGIKSYSLSSNQRDVEAPSDAVRTGTYVGFFCVISNLKYLLKPQTFNRTNTEFYGSNWTGIPNYVQFWDNQISIFPLINENFSSTTLVAAAGLSATDTTIVLANAGSFLEYNGRIQIGEEIISYERRDSATNTLVDCKRGLENTSAVAHANGAAVDSKNFYVYYYKNHWKIPLLNSSTIDPSYLSKEMEISDDHIEGVIDEASYKLLSKIDISRADLYKRDYEEFLRRCKAELVKGRDNTRTYTSTRQLYPFEYGSQSRVY